MNELIDRKPAVNVEESEYLRLLGYPPRHVLDGRSRELADWARNWFAANGLPWIYARPADSLELRHERLQIDGAELASKSLHDQFHAADVHSSVLVAVSAGHECEEKARQLWQEEKPDEYFFLEMYGSAVVEHLITAAGGRICAWAEQRGMMVLPHYSPGYSGWDVSDQIRLWNLIRRDAADRLPGPIEVLDTGMLRPKKSLLAVFGVTRQIDKVRHFRSLVPCENCSLSACQYRRAPYKHSLPQIEDVSRLQSVPHDASDDKIIHVSVLNHNARYSVNVRALEKWSRERLQLKVLDDRTVEARFRYEGTTCVNLGRSLEFDYLIRLAAREDSYRIVNAVCVPAADNSGYQSMCEYLNNPEQLMSSIASEKPLLGQPLNEVLNWHRPYNPSGCYCDSSSRAHKWGLALEVIHFALVKYERNASRENNRQTVNS